MGEANESVEGITKILFVCYGNTCRSPMAEAVFNDLVVKQNVQSRFFVDSAGISEYFNIVKLHHCHKMNFLIYQCLLTFLLTGKWQEGDDPNKFVKSILSRNQIPVSHKARQITVEDFKTFDYIVGMDRCNMTELNRYKDALNTKSQVVLLGVYNSNQDEKIICDPFFDDRKEDFEKCFEQISSSCTNFLRELLTEEGTREIAEKLMDK